MDGADRTRACYLHSCLRFVERDPMTNASLRERFGIEPHNSAVASRIIRETMEEEKLIKPYDPKQGKKYAKCVPFWA
jgi:predicted HTH transcriptional regulator